MSVNWDYLEETGTEGHTNTLHPLHIWGTLAYICTQVSALWQPLPLKELLLFNLSNLFNKRPSRDPETPTCRNQPDLADEAAQKRDFSIPAEGSGQKAQGGALPEQGR